MGIRGIIGVAAVTVLLAAAASGCALPANAMAGTVEHISFGPDGITVVVDGQEINLTADTEIGGLLAEGTVIKVTLEVQDDGSLLATKVDVEGNGSGDDSEDDGKIKLEGTIESLSPSGDGMVVDGKTISIDGNTVIEGTLVVGADVEVKLAVQDDESLLALKIEVEGEGDLDEDSDDGEDAEDSQDAEDGQETEVKGTITSLSDNNNSMVVDGQTIAIDGDTVIEGTLVAGAEVEVKLAVQEDDSLLALKIEAQDEGGVDEGDGDQPEDHSEHAHDNHEAETEGEDGD